jgi:hypothetical protein
MLWKLAGFLFGWGFSLMLTSAIVFFAAVAQMLFVAMTQ